MDAAKKKRTVHRTAFTKAHSALTDLLRATLVDDNLRTDVTVAFQLLEGKMLDLQGSSQSVIELMILTASEEEIAKEYDDADEYQKKFLSAKLTVSEFLCARAGQAPSQTSHFQQASSIHSEVRKTFNLPKIELVKFDGNLLNWLQFWSMFKKIHEDKSIREEDKFVYLNQAMVPQSRAAELVQSFPPTSDNYKEVIESLTNRFGQEDLLIEVYVRELLQLVLKNATNKNKDVALSSLYDKIESHLRALKSLGVTTDKCGAMLYPLVESCLPEELLRAWQRSSVYNSASNSAPDGGSDSSESCSVAAKNRLSQLIKFLSMEVQNEVRISMAVKGFDLKSEGSNGGKSGNSKKHPDSKDVPSAVGLIATSNKVSPCIFCDSIEHISPDCEKAKKMTLSERKDCAQKKRACFRCLISGHGFYQCKVRVKCTWCNGHHVLLMCRKLSGDSGDTTKKIEAPDDGKTPGKSECSLASLCLEQDIVILTLKAKLFSGTSEHIVRVVLDTASQRSYITKAAARLLGYTSICDQRINHSLFGGLRTESKDHKKYLIRLRSLCSDYACNFIALDEAVICESVPSLGNGVWLQELRDLNIDISDVANDSEPVSVLIGGDVLGKLLTGRLHHLDCGLTAIETYLGWTVTGKVPGTEREESTAMVAISMFSKSDVTADLWSLDTLGIRDPIEEKLQKDREREIAENFLKSVKVNADHRFEVQLPFLENHPALGDNKTVATSRLRSTADKLKSGGLYAEYDAVFKEWIDKGIIEVVPEQEKREWGHYLPHRPVVKESSTTTKIRPVFDASAKDREHPSLNDCVEKGTNLIEPVNDVLLRFRLGKIGVISDIEKAFLQISIDPKDRDFLRFLWFDEHGNIIILRHCRLVFGLSCSPFILGAVIHLLLRKNLSLEERELCELLMKLLKSYYVDNSVTSVNSIQELREFKSFAVSVMKTAGFNLRGWEYTGDDSDNEQSIVLGIVWNKKSDTLSVNLNLVNDSVPKKITKRVILSLAHQIFDPLGFVCPIVLVPRILLQEICLEKLSWDDPVSDDVAKRFLNWFDELKDLSEVQIPRCILGITGERDRISLHTFCDASKVAFATVIFLRIENESGVRVHFVAAKTRVAPTKQTRQNTPRLELLAACIGARLTKKVLDALDLDGVEVFYWSDSTTVLAWIRRNSNWATFVWNRVLEIRELSDPECWRFVPGLLNPADLPSRGCKVHQLLSSQWWEGPEFLYKLREEWPIDHLDFDEEAISRELKKSVIKEELKCTTLMTLSDKTNLQEMKPWYVEKYSDYNKIVRVLAWMIRFVSNCRAKVIESREKSRVLCSSEMKNSEKVLLQMIQSESFQGLEDERIKQLNPFKDENGLIRLKSKIVLRDDTFNFRCPIILPGNHDTVRLIIEQKHQNLNHAGVEILLSNLREEYWILGGRKSIRAVLRGCKSCQRHESKSLQVDAPPLPLNRVRDASIFEITGVDFTGPIYLRGGTKAWICLFTCAVFRAVHLELVKSLSTASFLMALRRFSSKRGRPSVIYSDNGSNFVGLNNLLEKLDYDKFFQITKIEWKFNPPTAAWWGGFWERMNGILKRLLRRTLKKSCLDYEEMLTVLCDCEAVINSRPITFLSENDHDIVPLSPSMFLQEIKEVGMIDLDAIEKCDLNRRYAYRQEVKQALRKRFRNEYLGALMCRGQKARNRGIDACVRAGDVVLIENDNAKRMDWPLARVMDVISGKDGKVRVVRLKTAGGELTRPIQRIHPLEVKCFNSESKINEAIVEKYEDVKGKECSETSDGDRDEIPPCSELIKCVTRSGRKVRAPNRLSYH